MSQTIRNGTTIRLSIEVGQKLSVVAVKGTYSVSVLAGTGAGTSLATNATGGTYGPYAYASVVQIVSSALSEIDFDVGVTTTVDSDTVALLATDPLTGNVTGVLGQVAGVPNQVIPLGGSSVNGNFTSVNGTATQNFGAGNDVKVAAILNTVLTNPLSWWDATNKWFLPTLPGNYLVTAALQSASASAQLQVSVFKNGASVAVGAYQAAGSNVVSTVSAVVTCNGTTDKIEIHGYQSVTALVGGVSGNNFANFVYLGPDTGTVTGGGGASTIPVAFATSRNSAGSDNGLILENATASTLTLTLVAGTIPTGITLMNDGTGQTIVTAGAGVTFVDGSTSVTAPSQGQMIHVIPTATANKFLVKVG